MLNIKAHCKMQDIRRLSLGLILIICSASSFSQSSFGFREMASDSVLIADDVCDICIGSILFNRRFEIIEHTVDSIGDGKGEFNCLSPNNGISAYQFYVESSNYDSLRNIFNRIYQGSILMSQNYGCDSTLEFETSDSLTYSNYYFIIHEIEDSLQTIRFTLYDKSVKDVYLLFLTLEKLCDYKESVSYKEIQDWTSYFKRRSIDIKED